MLEFVFEWARIIYFETLSNNMWWCRCCLIYIFLRFLQFSSCGPWRVFSHSNSPSHCASGWYKHTSSSRLFRNIFCWLEILHHCPDGRNGNFHCSSSFLKATSLICEAQSSIYMILFTKGANIFGHDCINNTTFLWKSKNAENVL